MKDEMDRFMIENRLETSKIPELKNVFSETMNICNQIWGNQSFKRPDGRNEMIQGIFDAQTISVSQFLNRKDELIEKRNTIREGFNRLYFKDKKFEISVRQFTSNIKQVEYQLEQ